MYFGQVFLKIIQVDQIIGIPFYLFTLTCMYTNGLGKNLFDFFTNSSGHPAGDYFPTYIHSFQIPAILEV
jgi:hypothetical protein